MKDDQAKSRIAAILSVLEPKNKQPASTKVLNAGIAQAEGKVGEEAQAGRLGWLIASSVAIAAASANIEIPLNAALAASA